MTFRQLHTKLTLIGALRALLWHNGPREETVKVPSLNAAKLLKASGLYADALRELDSSQIDRSHRGEARVLRVDLLEAVGRHGEARLLASSLLSDAHRPSKH